jgi:hypothetical protein
MRIEITHEIRHVLVDEHLQRLREAAQAPARPVVTRIWAIIRRRPEAAPAPSIAPGSTAPGTDRLAA